MHGVKNGKTYGEPTASVKGTSEISPDQETRGTLGAARDNIKRNEGEVERMQSECTRSMIREQIGNARGNIGNGIGKHSKSIGNKAS